MKNYLKKYKIIIKTIGPLFIGDGKELVKREYILNKKTKTAAIVDTDKLFCYLMDNNKLESYEKYLLGKNGTLQSLLYDENVPYNKIRSFIKYEYDCSDIADLNTMKNILTCTKDSYGNPYVPGSSLKGAIRTILLGADIIKNNDKYQRHINNMLNEDFKNRKRVGREAKTVEKNFFNIVKKTERGAATSDFMRGIRISDSKPLGISDLTLCQKIDVSTKGEKNVITERRKEKFPLLRECIKPGTQIEFDLVIDSTECDIRVEQIRNDINLFLHYYNELFLGHFKKQTLYDKNVIYLGGGAGFATKTVLHDLLMHSDRRTLVVSKTIDMNLPFKIKSDHKHYNDVKIGVSPHTCKLTEYDGDLLQMGACSIEIV